MPPLAGPNTTPLSPRSPPPQRSDDPEADDMASLMRRTLVRTSAPIFNSLRRIGPCTIFYSPRCGAID